MLVEIRPQKGPQEAFLSSRADIAVMGGSAGGSKTFSLLMNPLRHIRTVKDYGAVIFRRTVPEITNEGGLWDEACGLYVHAGGVPYVSTHEFRFPPYGNTISMAGLEEEKDLIKWHSSQICCLELDELTTFSAKQFWYLTSRNRHTCGIRPSIRAGCNPAPNWVKHTLLAPWVDEDFPGIRAQSGELRYFVRIDGKMHWVEEGHPDAQSVTFIRASVYDNKILLERNPEYLRRLKGLDPVERARLLDGDWRIMYEGLVYPEVFEAVKGVLVEKEQRPQKPYIGGMDFGIRNPFVALWGYVDHEDVLWITNCYYKAGLTIPQHSPNLPVGIKWWADPAGAEERTQLKRAGHNVFPCTHQAVKGATGETKNPKLAGISMVRERLRTGRLKIVRPKCRELIRELGLYIYDKDNPEQEEPIKVSDHAPDALRYLVVGIDRGKAVPAVPYPSMTEELYDMANWE
jgi:phage terminase large subunit